MVLNSLAHITLIAIALLQVPDGAPLTFGSVGKALTRSELEQITRLARETADKQPWLISGFNSFIPGNYRVSVYLPPDHRSGAVRRGQRLRLVADGAIDASVKSPWKLQSIDAYAQVARPDGGVSVQDEWDLARPFAVDSDIDDSTLSSLVEFIRSKPVSRGAPKGQASRNVEGQFPISGVKRQGNRFCVTLFTGELQGCDATLERRGNRWTVVSYEFWIV